MAVLSYLYPGAFFNASFVVFMTGYHLLQRTFCCLTGKAIRRRIFLPILKECGKCRNYNSGIGVSSSTSHQNQPKPPRSAFHRRSRESLFHEKT